MAEKEENFFGTEESLLNLPSGDLRIHASSDFASTMKAQQTERANNSVEAKSESILSPSSQEIKTTEETISKTAINHFFKMFYDSYMANNDSDLKYRLGKVSSVVPKTYKVQTTSNFKSKFNVETGYGKIKISNQYFLNHFFPPYQPLEAEESTSSKVYRKWDDAHNKWEILSNGTEATTNYDLKNLILESDDFTYRGSGFKSINDNIFQVQRILEHTTGVVSTYLTEWDISLYLQEGILDKSTNGKANIGLLYRIFQDNPSRYDDIRALSWGVLNTAVSKISAVSGIINAPKAHINPSYFPFSSNWTEYDSFNRGDGLDIFYDIATTNLTTDSKIETSHIKLNSYSNLDILGKKYSSLGYREKLYFWDCKGAAYSGWKNWSNLRYYNAVYTTPDDSLSDIDMVHSSETEGKFGWCQTQTENSIIQRVVQSLYNNDESLGFEINEWKIKRNMQQSTNPSDPSYRYDYYIRNPITGGPSFVASATYRSDNKIINWYDENGKELESIENKGILQKFKPYDGLLKHPLSLRYFLSRTCKYWPEIVNDFGNKCPCENDTILNIEENQENKVSTTQKSNSNSGSAVSDLAGLTNEDLGSDVCNSGVPRWNPFFYGGPHGRDKSPFIVSSMFDEKSRVLRNVPRIEPKFTDEAEQIGVEKFYNYNTDEFVEPLKIRNYGATRSPSSNLIKLIRGDITSELKKSEEYITYRELLPWVQKSRISNCKVEYYDAPKYKELGMSYDKKGADTVVYDDGNLIYGDIVEHTGFFSPDSIPSAEQFPTYKTYGKGSWYSTMAYEWANYFQYATEGVTYYKGNTIQSELSYPYTPNPADASSIAKTYGAKSPTVTGGNYNSSVAQGVPSAAYGGPNPGANWEMKTARGQFYELLCTYKAKGKYGTWHRWEIRYVETPIVYSDLESYWQIDEFTEYEYTTSEDKKSKIGNTALGIFTGGISGLFTTKQINATAVAGSGKKRYRLILGEGRTAEQLENNDDSFKFQSDAEKKLEQVLMGDIKDNTGKNWKKCFFFVAPTSNDMTTKGPEAIFSMYLKKSKMKAVVTETSTNAVGCSSASGRTTDKIVDFDYIEVYNYKEGDELYDKTLKPEIYTGFNPNYMGDGKEVFNPSTINFDDLSSVTPTTEKNAQRFINNIFAAHTDESGVCSDAEQILYLLGEDTADLGEEQDDTENEFVEYDENGKEIGRKRYLYRVLNNKEPQKTYGWGFTTYFPGIGGDKEGVDRIPENFKKKLNLKYRSDEAHYQQREFVYQWWPKQLEKKLRYTLSNSKPEKEEIRDDKGNLIEVRYWNTYVDSNERRNHSGNPNEPLAPVKRVLKDSAEEKEIKNMKAFPDKAERTKLGIEKGNWYFNNWVNDPYDRPLSWFFERTTQDGYYESWENESMRPENFGASIDFWCANDVYGKSFERAKGYYKNGYIFAQTFKNFFTTSTFFLENTETTEGVDSHYEDVTSPCIIDSSVPYEILYACVCLNYTWALESKNYIKGVLGPDNTAGANFRKVIETVLNKRILIDSGITPVRYDNGKAVYAENKNSLYYNPWVKFIYDNCNKISTLYENFDSMINTLKNCKEALNCIDYNTSFQSKTINQLKTLKSKAASVQEEAFKIDENEIPTIFEYIYSYLNVLYEYRKFFIFKRCNKQTGTLFQVRNFESALPLVEQNLNDKKSDDIPDYKPGDSNIHSYDVAMALTQNTNTEKAQAAAERKTLDEDRWAIIYIPVVEVDENDPALLQYIEYFDEHDGEEIPSNMQRYVYIKKIDRWIEVPFNDNYVLESSEYISALSTIYKNNIILEENKTREIKKDLIDLDEGYLLKSENGTVITPLVPDSYVQSINWIDTSKVDYLDNIIQSVDFSGPDGDKKREKYHYKVPYYEFDPGATDYPFIYFGITDSIDIDKFIEYQKSGATELDTTCAARIAHNYWQVTLTSKLPYKRLYESNLRIETYLGNDSPGSIGPDEPPFLNGPYTSQIWPIYSHQAADVPSLQDTLLGD